MLEAKPPFKLTSLQANLISLLLVGLVMAALLVLSIGYRYTAFGILAMAGMVAAGLAAAIFVLPQLGAYILVVSIFTNVSSLLTDQGWFGINKPLVALVFMSIVAHHFFYRAPLLPFKRTEWFMLAYGGVWLVSLFVAEDQDRVIERVIDFTKDFVILLCIVYPLASRPEAWRRTLWLIILAAAILAGLGAYQVLSGNTDQTFFNFSKFIQGQIAEGFEDRGRLSGPVDDPNVYGQILVAVLPLAIYRLLDERRLVLRLLAGVSTLLFVFGIFNTYSRGAFLAMLLIMLLIALQQRVRLSLIALVIIVAVIMQPLLPVGFAERLETLSIFTSEEGSVHSEVSFRGRSSEMLTGLHIFAEHPLLGVGVGNYIVHYQDYASRLGLEQRTEDRQAHSLYIETAAETGILGLITFGGLMISLLVGLTQAHRKLKAVSNDPHWASWIASLQLSVIAYLTSSIFLHGDYIRYLWLFVALGVAMIHLSDNLAARAQPQILAGVNR
jgi:O-antigen ligase